MNIHFVCQGSIGSRDIVLIPASYPVDGKPATVQVLSLAAARASDPAAADLTHSPGPLLKGNRIVQHYDMLYNPHHLGIT